MTNAKTRWERDDPPNLLLAIDPGFAFKSGNAERRVPYVGCALFQHGRLVGGKVVKCAWSDALRFKGPRDLKTGKAADGVKNMDGVVPTTARLNELVRAVCIEMHVARHHGEISRVGAGKRVSVAAPTLGENLTVLAVEKPMLYAHGPARPEDIINLRSVYGAFMGGIDADFYAGPTPEQWKGSIDGDILCERVANVLSVEEQILLAKAQANGDMGLSTHVLDAAGIGLYVLGRAGKAMVV